MTGSKEGGESPVAFAAIAANGGAVPIAEATVALGLNREQIIRRIQRGELTGGQMFGRWFVARDAIECAQSHQDASSSR